MPSNSSAGVGVDSECHPLIRSDAADVRFVDVRDNPHLGQVRRDDEQLRGLKAGRDSLPDVDEPRRDDAVDRGTDNGVLQVDLVHAQRRLRLPHLGLGRLQLRLGGPQGHCCCFQFGLGDEIAGSQFARPPELRYGVVDAYRRAFHLGLGAQQVGARLLELRLEQRRIEAHDDVALADDGVEVDVELLDDAGDLASDLYGRHRLEGAGRSNGVDDVALSHGDGSDVRHDLDGSCPVEAVGSHRGAEDDDDGKGLLHCCSSSDVVHRGVAPDSGYVDPRPCPDLPRPPHRWTGVAGSPTGGCSQGITMAWQRSPA